MSAILVILMGIECASGKGEEEDDQCSYRVAEL